MGSPLSAASRCGIRGEVSGQSEALQPQSEEAEGRRGLELRGRGRDPDGSSEGKGDPSGHEAPLPRVRGAGAVGQGPPQAQLAAGVGDGSGRGGWRQEGPLREASPGRLRDGALRSEVDRG